MMTKKYKLHCFGCGYQFFNKKEVERLDGKPYCGECMADLNFEDIARYLPEPGEQDQIDKANIAKYGEY